MSANPWPMRLAKGALLILTAIILLPQPGYRGDARALLAPAQYAVDLAAQSGQVDPSGTVFGLGPLSRLATRTPGVGPAWTLVFDLLTAAALIYALFLLFRRADSAEALLGILAGALLVEGVRSYLFPLAVTLWLALLAILLDYARRENLLSLLAAAGLSWSLFYFQSGIGLAALAFVAATLVFRLVWPGARRRRFTGLALAGWLALGPILAVALRIDLTAHVVRALRLRALAAAPAPALPIGNASGSEFLLLALTILAIYAGVLLANRRALRGQAPDWLACGLVGALLLLAFREAFARPWGHPWLFFQAAAAAIGILALSLANRAAARRLGGAFVAVLILSFPAVSANAQAGYVSARLASLRSYAAATLNLPQPDARDPRLEAYLLPPRLLEIIGDGTVDAPAALLPTIVANDLAYQPSAALRSPAELPGEIGSEPGPRFIMLGLGGDPAYDPFPAGAPARLDLWQNYRSIWRFGDNFLLLERLPQPRALTAAPTTSASGRIGEAVALPVAGGIQQLQVDLDLSALGALWQAAAPAPQVELVTQYADGGQEAVRLTADQLRQGVQLAPVVNDLATAELFSVASGHLNRPVQQFWLRTSQPWAFRPQFDYTVGTFDAANAARAEWPTVSLDDGQQVRLAAVQYDLEPGAVALDAFWEVDPATVAPGLALGQTAFARLLDEQGNTAAAAEVELRDRATGLRTLASGPRRYLAARLRLPLPADAAGATFDLEVGLTPTGQPPQNAVWQTTLPAFVRTASAE